LQALEREHEAAGGRICKALVCKHGVIASARGDGGRDALGVALEDGARVVVKRVDDREVKAQSVRRNERGELTGKLAQVLRAAARWDAGGCKQPVDLVEHLDAT
jgi:hypothetical protein